MQPVMLNTFAILGRHSLANMALSCSNPLFHSFLRKLLQTARGVQKMDILTRNYDDSFPPVCYAVLNFTVYVFPPEYSLTSQFIMLTSALAICVSFVVRFEAVN